MFQTSTALTASIIVALVIALHLPVTAEAGIAVGEAEFVKKKKVKRTSNTFLYTYKLNINNDGPALDDVKVFLSCDDDNVTLIDDIVEFGNLAAGQMLTSSDSFTFQQVDDSKKKSKKSKKSKDSKKSKKSKKKDRDDDSNGQSSIPQCLVYEIGFETLITISGIATDMPLANATVIGRVIHPSSGRPIVDSGRPIVDVFSTTTNADGEYTLQISAITTDDFITLTAEGTGDQEGATLTSTVGSVGSLTDTASDDFTLDSSDEPALDITHITTALAVLAEQANGGPITSDGQLAAAQAQVDGGELLEMAALIKAVIDNPNIDLPPGVNSTLELVSDPPLFEAFLEEVQTDFPTEYQDAIDETADQLTVEYDPAEVPGVTYLALVSDSPFSSGALALDLAASNTGAVTFFAGSSNVTWTVDVDGNIVLDLLNPPTSEFFPVCPPGSSTPGLQCRAVSFIDRITIQRLANGLLTDQVFVLNRRVTTYPDDPGVPDEIFEDQPDPSFVHLSFRADASVPFQTGDFSGTQIATAYYHQDNDAIGTTVPTFGADFLTFNANRTGTTARRGFIFGWAVDADGIANITFANGDTNQYIRYSIVDGISKTVLIGALATGETQSAGTPVIEHDGVSEFSESMLSNRRYRAVWTFTDRDIGLDIFDFLFLPDGTGCRITGFGGSVSAQRFDWVSTADNNMDLFRPWSGDPTITLSRRSWEAAAITTGELGDRYWLIENLDFNGNLDPLYMFADPTITPGRMNNYEFIEDLTGQADPCGFGPPGLDPPLIIYDEQIEGDINGTYGQGPTFELGVGTNTIQGVGNGPIPDPAGALFDFDVFSIVIPAGHSLVAISLDGWGTQIPTSLFMRVREGIQPAASFQWTVGGGRDPSTGQQATPQSIAADVAAIPLNLSEYTFNNSGALFDPGIPYRWTFVVQ